MSEFGDKVVLVRDEGDEYETDVNGARHNGDQRETTVRPTGSGEPAVPWYRELAVPCILVVELCERLVFYSMTGNMVLFCTSVLGYGNADAITVNTVFIGTCYFVPVFGGWVADSLLGRFNTILGSALIYVVGVMTMPAVALDYSKYFGSSYGMTDGERQGFYLFGISLIAIGTGGIKSNIGPFGAQQLEDRGYPDTAIQSFFNWFYLFINLGSAVAFSVMVYIQQDISFALGYFIPAVFMVIAVIIFVAARKRYVPHYPGGSVLTRVFKMVVEGVRGRLQRTHALDSFLDHAKRSQGGSFPDPEVEETKSLGRIIPVFLMLIFFWTVYTQMSNSYLLQGEVMDISIGSFQIPVASLSLFDAAVIIMLVPLVDVVIFPFLDRFGLRPSMLQRIGIGMAFAAVSVTIAGILEIFRLQNLSETGGFTQVIAGTAYNASHYSVFLQIPQFVWIGAGEVFTSITSLEFAYSQAPSSLQGVVMGMNLVTTGLGNYMATAVVNIVNAITAPNEWLPDDVNEGHLDYFFFLLAGLMVVNLLIYIPVAHFYKYAPTNKDGSGGEEVVSNPYGPAPDTDRGSTSRAGGTSPVSEQLQQANLHLQNLQRDKDPIL